jgi:hypothetical protein
MTLLGKYELHEILGKGGYGTVYRATDLKLNRVVAIKILHPQLAADEQFIERFRREAQIAAALENPFIVHIYDVDEAGGRFFLAMQYLPGGSLADILKQGPLPVARIQEIVEQVCQGLAALHTSGYVHRDLKPANILFNVQRQAVVSDFGLARALSTSSGSSSTGMAGTPSYRAPELWRGKPPATPATDIYSLGCILAEMLTGKVIFSGETTEEVLTKHVLDGPDFGPDWPPLGKCGALAGVVEKALSRDPSQRYPTATAFAADLANSLEEGANHIAGERARQEAALQAERERLRAEQDEKARIERELQEEIARQQKIQADLARQVLERRKLAEEKARQRAFRMLERQRRWNNLKSYGLDRFERWKSFCAHLFGRWYPRYAWTGIAIVPVILGLYLLSGQLWGQTTVLQVLDGPIGFQQLYFTSNRDGSLQVYRQDAVTGTVTRMTHPANGTCWSPAPGMLGSLYITCERNGKKAVYWQDPKTGALSQMTNPENGECWDPALGPGDNVYFTCVREGMREIYYQERASGKVIRVTSADQGENWDPALGPNNDLYFTSNREGKLEIYRLSSQTGQVSRMTALDRGECWGPVMGPSKEIYFTCNRTSTWQIFRLEITGEVTQMTGMGSQNWNPVIGPGENIYFTSNRSGQRDVYRMDRVTGAVTRMINTVGAESWTGRNQ